MLLSCAAATLAVAVAAVPTPRSAHHQSLLDAYEASKLRCSHGHLGIIVMMHEGSPSPYLLDSHLRKKKRHDDRFGHVFATPHTIRGISARLSADTLEEMLRDGEIHGIEGVHADCLRKTTLPKPETHAVPQGIHSLDASKTQARMAQGVQAAVSNWGLDYSSKLSGPDGEYDYGSARGKNTVLYHVDTGVQMSHEEFQLIDPVTGVSNGTRVLKGWSMGCTNPNAEGEQHEECSKLWVYGANITDEALNRVNVLPSEDDNDPIQYTDPGRGCDAHGTHTASVVLGNKYGVAKEAKLVAIQGLSCVATAQDSLVVKALEMIVEDARSKSPYSPAVVLLSLGGEKDIPLNEAVKRTTQHHVNVVVAAGNDHCDACTTTPSAVTRATTVAAITEDKALASFSSYGKCVDLCAPGMSILAGYAVVGSASGAASLSGTSMAAPFVAGAMLQALSVYPQMTTGQTKMLLRCVASKGQLHGEEVEEDTPNMLVRFGNAFETPATVRTAIEDAYKAALEVRTHVSSTVTTLSMIPNDEAFRKGCVELVDKLDADRPENGRLLKSPDVNLESVILPDDTILPPSLPPGMADKVPYDLASKHEDSAPAAMVPPRQ